ncbi:uncharacterized protein LOC133560910 isoform X1 [Nerophis ophidion]|uniref:uncharacterized protein LOC133560910 isoform X1 n=1 Tax=Nerophis ophidion TaxID=159077 RepID=UPI002AE07567|nr:uncharacterized protein LOC133560910 isoform X1 [Nerophis ophidion]XP_061769926.1 uncharacterized protein LOC133560910 isoform X1 [Nerophis ophidion]
MRPGFLGTKEKACPAFQQSTAIAPLSSPRNSHVMSDSAGHSEDELLNTAEANRSERHCEGSHLASLQQEQTGSQANAAIGLVQRSHRRPGTSETVNENGKSFLDSPISSTKTNASYHPTQQPSHNSQRALDFGQMRAQNLSFAPLTVGGKQMCSTPLKCGHSPRRGQKPPTDEQIQSVIEERLAYFTTLNNSDHGSAATTKECQEVMMEVTATSTKHQEQPIVTKRHPFFKVRNGSLRNLNKSFGSNMSNKPKRCQDPHAKLVKFAKSGSKGERTPTGQSLEEAQYEDISDDDGERIKVCCKTPQYEDISDNETFEMPSPTESRMAPTQSDTYPQRGQTDAYCVIPLNLLSLKYEAPKAQRDVDEGATKETREQGQPAPASIPSSVPSLEVYDSSETYQQVNAMQFAEHFVVLDDEMDEMKETLQEEGFASVELDSGETEDSCDYSSGSEHNYMTVSEHLLNRSAPSCSEDVHSDHKIKVEHRQTSVGFKGVKHKTKEPTDNLITNKIIIVDSSDDENEVQLIDSTDSLHVHISTCRSITPGGGISLDCNGRKHPRNKRLLSGSLVPRKKALLENDL